MLKQDLESSCASTTASGETGKIALILYLVVEQRQKSYQLKLKIVCVRKIQMRNKAAKFAIETEEKTFS